MQLFIARHGQNEDNVNGVLNGRRDLPLTELGREQARQLAAGIKESGIEFDVIFSSPLSRAYETAQIIASKLGAPKPVVLELLIERDFGVMTGKPTAKIKELCGPDILETDTITYFLSPEGAETFPRLLERGHEAIDELQKRAAGKTVLVVCHGDIGKMIYSAAMGKPWLQVLKNFHFGNAELISVEGHEAHVIKLKQHNL